MTSQEITIVDSEVHQHIVDNIKRVINDSDEVFELLEQNRDQLKGDRLWLLYNLLKQYETWALVVMELYPIVEDCLFEGAPLPITNCTSTIKPLMTNRQNSVQDRLALAMLELYLNTGYQFLSTVLAKIEQEECIE